MKLSTLAAALSLAATCACAQSTLRVKQLMLDGDLNGTYATLTETQVNNLGIIASGSVILDDGSLSAPSLRFTSDTNTGIRRSASDTLQFVAGGASVGTWTTGALAVVGSISATTGINSTTIGASTPATGAFTTLTTTSTIAATGNITGANLAGTNTGDVTLTSGAGDILGLTGQTLDFDSQAANLFLASPNGSSGVPTFRAIAAYDLSGAGVGILAEEQAWDSLNSFLGGLEIKVATLAPPLVLESRGLTASTNETVIQLTTKTATAPLGGRNHYFKASASDSNASYNHQLPDASGTFVNTASSPLSVDATTGNLSLGTVPIANGGTNSTATPTAGGIAYGTGSAYAITSAGTSGQVLTSAGSGAPTWTTPSSIAGSISTVSQPAETTGSTGTSIAVSSYLQTNGNAVELELITDDAIAASDNFRLRFTGGATYTFANAAIDGTWAGFPHRIRARVRRLSATSVRWSLFLEGGGDGSYTGGYILTGTETVADLGATSYNFELINTSGDPAYTDIRYTFHRTP